MNWNIKTIMVVLTALSASGSIVARVNAADCNGNGTLDADEPDCNENTLPDDCDIAGKLYWGDSGTDRITRAYLDGSRFENVILSGVATPRGVAVDTAAGKLYWSDPGHFHIARTNLDGSGLQHFVTSGLSSPQALALDPLGGKLYWIDSGNDTIKRFNLDSSGTIETLLTNANGLMTPQTIALDLTAGRMYWTDFAANHIRSADLDGQNISAPITTGTNPYGIAVNPDEGKIYWTEWSTPRVRKANLDGSSPTSIVTTVDVNIDDPCGIVLDIEAGKVYWTDAVADVIRRCNLDGSDIMTLTLAGVMTDARPLAIALPAPDADTNGVPDECEGVPGLVSAVSSKPNLGGPDGFCDLPIDMVPGAPITTEPRGGGITEVIFTFDGPVTAGTVEVEADCTCPSPPSYAPIGATGDCAADGDTLVCTFDPALSNLCTYRLTVASGAGSASVELRGLVGDVTGDGLVNAVDRGVIVGAWTSPSGFTCATDLESSGRTNAVDRGMVVGAWTAPTNCAP